MPNLILLPRRRSILGVWRGNRLKANAIIFLPQWHGMIRQACQRDKHPIQKAFIFVGEGG